MKKRLIAIVLMATCDSLMAGVVYVDQLFGLTEHQHTGLAFDGEFFYTTTRKEQPTNILRKFTTAGDLVFEETVSFNNVLGLESIDGDLIGVQNNGTGSDEIVLFDDLTGIAVSSEPLLLPVEVDPVGLTTIGNEVLILSSPEDDFHQVAKLDSDFGLLETLPTALPSDSTISGFAAIGSDLFIAIHNESVLWKIDSQTGDLIDEFDLPFAGIAGLTTDGVDLFATSTFEGMLRISFSPISTPPDLPPISDSNPIPEPTTLMLFGLGAAAAGIAARRRSRLQTRERER